MADLRAELADALNGWMSREQLDALLNEILAIRKQVSHTFTCKHCQRMQKHMVEVADAAAVARALKDLAAEGFGRPKEQQVAEAERIMFVYERAD